MKNLLLAIIFCWTASANASLILSENLGGTASSATDVFWGQSVMTGSGGPWSNIQFNFYQGSSKLAWGNLYVLTSQYNGNPNGLSSASNVLGVATASAGLWSFSSSVILSANTMYWFYSESALADSLTGNNDVQGSGYSYTFNGSTNFAFSDNDINYTLAATLSEVPAPSSLALLALSLLFVRNLRKR